MSSQIKNCSPSRRLKSVGILLATFLSVASGVSVANSGLLYFDLTRDLAAPDPLTRTLRATQVGTIPPNTSEAFAVTCSATRPGGASVTLLPAAPPPHLDCGSFSGSDVTTPCATSVITRDVTVVCPTTNLPVTVSVACQVTGAREAGIVSTVINQAMASPGEWTVDCENLAQTADPSITAQIDLNDDIPRSNRATIGQIQSGGNLRVVLNGPTGSSTAIQIQASDTSPFVMGNGTKTATLPVTLSGGPATLNFPFACVAGQLDVDSVASSVFTVTDSKNFTISAIAGNVTCPSAAIDGPASVTYNSSLAGSLTGPPFVITLQENTATNVRVDWAAVLGRAAQIGARVTCTSVGSDGDITITPTVGNLDRDGGMNLVVANVDCNNNPDALQEVDLRCQLDTMQDQIDGEGFVAGTGLPSPPTEFDIQCIDNNTEPVATFAPLESVELPLDANGDLANAVSVSASGGDLDSSVVVSCSTNNGLGAVPIVDGTLDGDGAPDGSENISLNLVNCPTNAATSIVGQLTCNMDQRANPANPGTVLTATWDLRCPDTTFPSVFVTPATTSAAGTATPLNLNAAGDLANAVTISASGGDSDSTVTISSCDSGGLGAVTIGDNLLDGDGAPDGSETISLNLANCPTNAASSEVGQLTCMMDSRADPMGAVNATTTKVWKLICPDTTVAATPQQITFGAPATAGQPTQSFQITTANGAAGDFASVGCSATGGTTLSGVSFPAQINSGSAATPVTITCPTGPAANYTLNCQATYFLSGGAASATPPTVSSQQISCPLVSPPSNEPPFAFTSPNTIPVTFAGTAGGSGSTQIPVYSFCGTPGCTGNATIACTDNNANPALYTVTPPVVTLTGDDADFVSVTCTNLGAGAPGDTLTCDVTDQGGVHQEVIPLDCQNILPPPTGSAPSVFVDVPFPSLITIPAGGFGGVTFTGVGGQANAVNPQPYVDIDCSVSGAGAGAYTLQNASMLFNPSVVPVNNFVRVTCSNPVYGNNPASLDCAFSGSNDGTTVAFSGSVSWTLACETGVPVPAGNRIGWAVLGLLLALMGMAYARRPI